MTEYEMKQRTKAFALRVLKLVEALPTTIQSDVLKRQIVRSGTSVASGCRAACRAKSSDDFLYKLSLVEEEADETELWLELLAESGMLPKKRLAELKAEAGAITAMMVSAQKTMRGTRAGPNPKPKPQNPK